MEYINFNKEKRYMVWGNMEMINTKYLSYFKIKSLFVLVMTIIISVVFMGCGTSTPLDGKDTDEIIIMCLEDTYPEHQFHVIESYDNQKREGVFADENGVEFKVTNTITYQYSYHFGCDDEYLYELLNQQGYIEKVEKILHKYDLELRSSDDFISTEIMIEDSLNLEKCAEMVLEILNCVEVPKVIWPEEQGFSTGEINYYSRSRWNDFCCYFEDTTKQTAGALFYFTDKSKSISEIQECMEETIMKMQEELRVGEEEPMPEFVQTDFGSYAIGAPFWSLNGELSTKGKYVYTHWGETIEEYGSYFVIGCNTNPYTVEQHKLFRQSILSRLMKNNNLPENAQINATGFTTENGNTAYSFEIVMSDNEVMTMHYIVGDKRHCLIQEINCNNSESCSEAVQHVINTFSWKE